MQVLLQILTRTPLLHLTPPLPSFGHTPSVPGITATDVRGSCSAGTLLLSFLTYLCRLGTDEPGIYDIHLPQKSTPTRCMGWGKGCFGRMFSSFARQAIRGPAHHGLAWVSRVRRTAKYVLSHRG